MTYCRKVRGSPSPDNDPIPEAFEAQIRACASLGSTVAVQALSALADNYLSEGPVHRLMARRFERPIHDAAPLRILAGLHRLVLQGMTPTLARHFPTVGGSPGDDLSGDTIHTVMSHFEVLDRDLNDPVQTNEVGRSIVHMALAQWLGHNDLPEFDLVEVGSSAGLNLNFERYGAITPAGSMGDDTSRIVFGPEWFSTAPPLARRPARTRRVVGSDPHPIDVTSDDGARRLLSFVWPDQTERFERLRTAIDIARNHVPDVRRASADVAVDDLVTLPLEAPTVVFHSITWQYMGADVQRRFVAALGERGHNASITAPLIWARMEPAGPVADIRVTVWDGAPQPRESVLGTIGYHGQGLSWNEREMDLPERS